MHVFCRIGTYFYVDFGEIINLYRTSWKNLYNFIQNWKPYRKRSFSLRIQKSRKESLLNNSFNFNILTMSLLTTLMALFFYSTAMFTLPFAAFFGVQHVMTTEFHTDRFITHCVSVTAAVITVHLIIFCYVYKAFHEPDDESDASIASDINALKKN